MDFTQYQVCLVVNVKFSSKASTALLRNLPVISLTNTNQGSAMVIHKIKLRQLRKKLNYERHN